MEGDGFATARQDVRFSSFLMAIRKPSNFYSTSFTHLTDIAHDFGRVRR
jgi:hypothetical protein